MVTTEADARQRNAGGGVAATQSGDAARREARLAGISRMFHTREELAVEELNELKIELDLFLIDYPGDTEGRRMLRAIKRALVSRFFLSYVPAFLRGR